MRQSSVKKKRGALLQGDSQHSVRCTMIVTLWCLFVPLYNTMALLKLYELKNIHLNTSGGKATFVYSRELSHSKIHVILATVASAICPSLTL